MIIKALPIHTYIYTIPVEMNYSCWHHQRRYCTIRKSHHCRKDFRGCNFDGRQNGTMWLVLISAVIIIVIQETNVHASQIFISNFLQEHHPTLRQGSAPYFDRTTTEQRNTTGLVGKAVHLVCKVKNLGNLTVSWVRHRDIHLLTVGRYTYTSDQRFEALHTPHSEEWILKIRYPQLTDSGVYECQISTTPPIGYRVYLNIVEPITEILGGPDLFINKGSTINLTCLVRHAPEPPNAIIWSHDHIAINFDSPRGGISLVTEKASVTSSRLLIQKAIQQDSGLYTCIPTNTEPYSVRVHILNEHPAAMHHGCSSKRVAIFPIVLLFPSLIGLFRALCT